MHIISVHNEASLDKVSILAEKRNSVYLKMLYT